MIVPKVGDEIMYASKGRVLATHIIDEKTVIIDAELADGTIIHWSNTPPGKGQMYMRAKGRIGQIDWDEGRMDFATKAGQD